MQGESPAGSAEGEAKNDTDRRALITLRHFPVEPRVFFAGLSHATFCETMNNNTRGSKK